MPRDYRPWVKAAWERGWAVWMNGKTHIAFRGPDGQTAVVPGTPQGGKTRGRANYSARLRRAGLPVA